MRMIGHLPNEQHAKRFSDFLVVKGIANQLEADMPGWAVWVHAEDDLQSARDLLAQFTANPEDPQYQGCTRQAAQLRERERKEEEAAAKRFFSRRQIRERFSPYGVGPLTFVLIVLCVAIAILTKLGADKEVMKYLYISLYSRGLPEVMHGEIWRLLTPIVLHFGPWHILFNMLCLFDLGSMIEGRQGTLRLAILVIAIGLVSNLGQYYVSGPGFGGMSGVIYGLLGYIWMKGKFDPASGLFLHPQTVIMMLAWYFLCFTGWLGVPIANTVHTIGLVMGIAWGLLASLPLRKRRG